ncbi:hypothetical protein [Streptomyces sp. CAU 1734]|uniref:hypothetical protein n=1 Tax=Streptomyces sp. CAU 1734 TaxID=3140360 RepID=UPI0032612572
MPTIIVKVLGTVLVTALISRPLWSPGADPGILREVSALGISGALLTVAVFFGLVALYCRLLQRTLALIGPEDRAASPASVWWMFAIPYNFTEDFYIVRNLTRSLTADGRTAPEAVRRWAVLGYAWCAFQILSLLPGTPGYLGGAIAIPLWVAHWIMTARVRRALATGNTAVSPVYRP